MMMRSSAGITASSQRSCARMPCGSSRCSCWLSHACSCAATAIKPEHHQPADVDQVIGEIAVGQQRMRIDEIRDGVDAGGDHEQQHRHPARAPAIRPQRVQRGEKRRGHQQRVHDRDDRGRKPGTRLCSAGSSVPSTMVMIEAASDEPDVAEMLERELRALARLRHLQHAGDHERRERAEEDLADARERNADAEHELAVVPVQLADQPADATQTEQQPCAAPWPLDPARSAQAGPGSAGGRHRPGDVVDPDRSAVARQHDRDEVGNEAREPGVRRAPSARAPRSSSPHRATTVCMIRSILHRQRGPGRCRYVHCASRARCTSQRNCADASSARWSASNIFARASSG